MDRKCTYLRGAKHANRGLAFSPDGTTLALIEASVLGGIDF
jgi:hypothetical protein